MSSFTRPRLTHIVLVVSATTSSAAAHLSTVRRCPRVLVVRRSGWTTAVALLVVATKVVSGVSTPTATTTAGVVGAATRVVAPSLALSVIPRGLVVPAAAAAAIIVSALVIASTIVPAVVAHAAVPVATTAASHPSTAHAAAHTSVAVHSTGTASSTGTTHSLAAVHLLLAQRFLHVQQAVHDCVRLLQHHLVHGVVVFELDECEATFLARVLVGDHVHGGHVAELGEVLAQVVLVVLVLQATDKQFLHCGTRIRAVDVLAGHGSLGFNHTAIDLMGTGVLRIVDHVRAGVGDESEATRPLRLGVLHHDHVHNLAPLLEVGLQRVVGGAVVQATDEQLAQVLQLADVLRGTRTKELAIRKMR